MTKEQAETANWMIAQTWADGLGLEFAGVDLADCAVYPLLSTVGKIALVELEQVAKQLQAKEIADGQPEH